MKILKENTSDQVAQARKDVVGLYKTWPVPDNEILQNLPLFLGPMVLKKILFLHELYVKSLEIAGVITEFGVRWGPGQATFHALRTLYEPFNYTRRIIGFDTFSGFPEVDAKDGNEEVANVGGYDLPEGYEGFLTKVMVAREMEAPVSNVNKFELVKGDASKTVPEYLEKHPEMMISLAYFDFDIYQPTIDCLKAIEDRLSVGSVIAFDELNLQQFPGETVAVREFFGNKVRIHRSPFSQNQAYIVWGE